MVIIKPWTWLGPGVLVLSGLTACTIVPPATAPVVPDKPVIVVPELDSKTTLPLSVAVYISPRVLGRTAIMDLRQSDSTTKNVISNGPTGSATIAAVAEYFPAVFNKVYLTASFPDARLLKHKLDVVIAIQDTATRHLPGTGDAAHDIWETQIKLAICRPDGTQLDHYSVSATSKPATVRPTDPAALVDWIYQASEDSIKPAIRMALQRFPKADVLNRILTQSKNSTRTHDQAFWTNINKEFTQSLDKEKIFIPLPDMTLEQYLHRPDINAVENMVIGNSMVLLNTDLLAQYYTANPAGFAARLLTLGSGNKSISQVYTQQIQTIAAKKNPAQTALVFQRIKGFNKPKSQPKLATVQSDQPVAVVKQPPAPVTAAPSPHSEDNPEIQKSFAIIDSLKHIDNTAADAKLNNDESCMKELRRSKQDLLASAKAANVNVQLLRSVGSGAIVYTPGHCARPVASHTDASQSMHEAQRIALCGVQTVNCALAKTYTGMACQTAIRACMQQAPIAR